MRLPGVACRLLAARHGPVAVVARAGGRGRGVPGRRCADVGAVAGARHLPGRQRCNRCPGTAGCGGVGGSAARSRGARHLVGLARGAARGSGGTGGSVGAAGDGGACQPLPRRVRGQRPGGPQRRASDAGDGAYTAVRAARGRRRAHRRHRRSSGGRLRRPASGSGAGPGGVVGRGLGRTWPERTSRTCLRAVVAESRVGSPGARGVAGQRFPRAHRCRARANGRQRRGVGDVVADECRPDGLRVEDRRPRWGGSGGPPRRRCRAGGVSGSCAASARRSPDGVRAAWGAALWLVLGRPASVAARVVGAAALGVAPSRLPDAARRRSPRRLRTVPRKRAGPCGRLAARVRVHLAGAGTAQRLVAAPGRSRPLVAALDGCGLPEPALDSCRSSGRPRTHRGAAGAAIRRRARDRGGRVECHAGAARRE